MADEAKTTDDAQKPTEAATKDAAKGGSMIKMIIFAAVGLVAVIGITVGILMFMGGDAPAEVPAEDQHASGGATSEQEAEAADSHEEDMSAEDSIIAWLEADESVIEEIMKNLEALDYEPTQKDMLGEQAGMTAEDSLEEVNWLDKEKATLASRQSVLDKRQKELEALDRSVSQKLTTLEQAESTRISQLARLYDGMDPRSIAKLVANLDNATVVAILPRMKPKNASQVLALMPPKRAAALSKQLITIAGN